MDIDLVRAALAEEMRRRTTRRSLFAWSDYVLSPFGQHPAKHHKLMIEALEDIASGKNDRLLLMLPPGSAKSTYASVLFPVWFMGQRPNMKVIGASHTVELSERFSSMARRLIEEHNLTLGYNLRPDSRSKELWECTNGAEYKTGSVGGSISGYRADCAIIDDPVRGRDAAESLLDKARVWDWYRNDLLTRLKPGGRIVLVMTRWSEDDLAGRILDTDGKDRWRIIRLPALAEADDPLGRAEGEPLWPEWETLANIEDKRRTLGERDFQSLFQQHPRPPGGGLFLVGKIRLQDAASADYKAVVRAWDLSASTGGDWTVGVKLARYANGTFTILNVVRMRGDPSEVERAILDTAQEDGVNCRIDLPIDPGASGLMAIRYLTAALQGYHVTSSRESGDKTLRARPVISQVNVGNLGIVKDINTQLFIDELASFPGAKYDDCIDALARAFNALVAPAKPARSTNVNFMAR